MKDLNLLEEILYLGLHLGVVLIGGCEFGCVLGGNGCAFILVNLEARRHFIYNGVGVVESQFVNRSAGFPELKVRFQEFLFEVIPYFVHCIYAFSHPDVVLENLFSVEDNEGKVYFLTLG